MDYTIISIQEAEADINKVIDLAEERPVFINDSDHTKAIVITYDLYQTFVATGAAAK